jgi:prephenate dehydrogenase
VAAHVIAPILASPDWNRAAVVTDVGSVKGPLVAAVDRPRFVGGHPMAGSEQVGIEGASAELFVGATWVLTPTPTTDPAAYARVRSVLAEFGANVIALDPLEHDTLVAVVSHVPHLAAATLMALASDLGEEHGALLQLAAGGFRDMTRIAAGQPSIWPGICDDNAEAIVSTLDLLIDSLGAMRRRVAEGDHESLLGVLQRAATARRAMSAGAPRPEELVEVRIPVRDRPGALADVLVLATERGINVFDLEIAHSVEGDRGVLVVVIDAASAPTFAEALAGRGHRCSVSPVGPGR